MRIPRIPWIVLIFTAVLTACAPPGSVQPNPSRPQTSSRVVLNGAGASFPAPLYAAWFYQYNQRYPGVRINYQSIGSGGGIRQITEQTVDFGATDAPMTEEELAAAPGEIVHIPTVIGAIALTYHLPGVDAPLRLSSNVLADIMLGKITRWDHPAIQSLNPDLDLPDMPLTVVHRSDGSGTTYIFSDYLSKVSPEWERRIGRGKQLQWPTGVGAKGNEGVAGQIRQLAGALGYVELAYAIENEMPVVALQNRAGRFVEPTIESATMAGAGFAESMPEDFRISITDASGEGAYPIAAFTYLLQYREPRDPVKGRAFLEFVEWSMREGDAMAEQLLYAPLPAEVERKVLDALRTFHHKGEPLLD